MTVGLSVARTATPAAAGLASSVCWERESDYCGFGSIRAFKSTLPELFLVCIADEFALEGTSAPTADTAAVSYDDRPPWHQRSTALVSLLPSDQN